MKLILLTMLVAISLVKVCAGSDFPDEQKAPAELLSFIKRGESVLYSEAADLNGDGLQDYLLIIERPGAEEDGNLRELVILTRQKDLSLRVVKRNSKIVMCSKCGGGWGDPFSSDNVIAGRKTFFIENYGGGGLRWSQGYRFNYSKRDRTWQLVEVTVSQIDINDPNNDETKVYRPPRHFGKIDIADFDPGHFLGVGAR